VAYRLQVSAGVPAPAVRGGVVETERLGGDRRRDLQDKLAQCRYRPAA